MKTKIIWLLIIIAVIASGTALYRNNPSSGGLVPPKAYLGKWQVSEVVEEGRTKVSGSNATIEFLTDGTYKTTGGCNIIMVQSRYKFYPDGDASIQTDGTKMKCSDNVVEFHNLRYVYSFRFENFDLILNYRKADGKEGRFVLAVHPERMLLDNDLDSN